MKCLACDADATPASDPFCDGCLAEYEAECAADYEAPAPTKA